MEQVNNNTKKATWKQLNHNKRIQIEILLKSGKKAKEIAVLLGYSKRTIEREIKRGTVTVWRTKYDPYAAFAPVVRERIAKQEYSADAAQQHCDTMASGKGKRIKLGKNFAFAEYIEEKIGKDRLSPYGALQQAVLEDKPFKNFICVKTLYNYIDNGYFLNISNKDLWVKKDKKKRKREKVRVAHNNRKGRSIAERPPDIDKRVEVGHWEMDTVVGGKKACLLVFTERKTRKEIIIKLRQRSQLEVIKALDKLERRWGAYKFRKTFKSITSDNGGEFLSQEGIESSCLTNKNRTIIYYCHPYSAWERGSNENANRLIRRFIPKGANIENYTAQEISRIEHYINNYPRRLLGGYPPNRLYAELIA